MTSTTIPPGFVEQRSHKVIWWLKAGWETAVREALQSAVGTPHSALHRLRTPHSTDSALRVSGGRGAVQRVALGERGIAIVRYYRRGGFVRHFVRDLYWDRPPRPFAELLCTEIVRQRGVPTVEALGARVEWVTGGLYRGTLVTREAEGYGNLWEWLQNKPTGTERKAVVAAVAQAIAKLHDAGIMHADLNLTNVLVQIAADTPRVLLIDFDRARLFSGPLPRRWRERNLRRLRRSLAKLDPGGVLFSPADLEIFCRVYHQTEM